MRSVAAAVAYLGICAHLCYYGMGASMLLGQELVQGVQAIELEDAQFEQLAQELGEEVQVIEVEEAQFEMDASVFDQWMFGVNGVGSADSARRALDSQIALWMSAIDSLCQLSDAQKFKLQLAAKGDVKHFMDEVNVVRARFMLVRRDQNKINEIYQDIQPLALRFQRGIFGDEALLQKVLANTLDDEQLEKWLESERRRREFRYRARVDHLVLALGESLALSSKQMEDVSELILQRTKPAEQAGQYESYIMMYRLQQMPQEELKPLFDEAQWKALQQQMQQAKSIEPFLREQGLLQ